MLKKGMSKQEIEKELSGKGDFVKIDYLTRFIKQQDPPIGIKKFSYLKLAEIYEEKSLFSKSAKMFEYAASISLTFSEKINHLLSATEQYIKGSLFDDADYAMKKALSEANTKEKRDIYSTVKSFYKKQGEYFEKTKKRNHALRVYEKLLEMNLDEREKQEVKNKLLELYEKLGKLKKYFALKRIK